MNKTKQINRGKVALFAPHLCTSSHAIPLKDFWKFYEVFARYDEDGFKKWPEVRNCVCHIQLCRIVRMMCHPPGEVNWTLVRLIIVSVILPGNATIPESFKAAFVLWVVSTDVCFYFKNW